MQVDIKLIHPKAKIPKRGTEGAAGYDVYVAEVKETEYKDGMYVVTYDLGIAVKIPDGYFLGLYPRSSNYKKAAIQCNSVGVVDSDYVGVIMVKHFAESPGYKVGDRVGQLILQKYEEIEFNPVDELTQTERGENGFGSTGN